MPRGCAQFLRCTLAALCAVCPAAFGDTVATFADPAVNGWSALFRVDHSAWRLSGGWSGSGLDLLVPVLDPNAVFEDSTFEMTNVSILTDGHTLEGGQIDFFDSAGNLLLTVAFQQAHLFEPFGFGAGPSADDAVDIVLADRGTHIPGASFAFAFANRRADGSQTTYTAAFTSSGLPEAPTFVLLAAGVMALLTGRRGVRSAGRHAAHARR